jgi:hypothetical protein
MGSHATWWTQGWIAEKKVKEPHRITWDQRHDRSWSCREGGRIWREGTQWRWEIDGIKGAHATLHGAVGAAGDAWRKRYSVDKTTG